MIGSHLSLVNCARRDIAKVQYGWPVGLPLCRPLSGGLWEVRASLPSKREARIFFGFHDGMLVAVHAIIKKTRKTRRKISRWRDSDFRSCNHGKEKPAHRFELRELARRGRYRRGSDRRRDQG